MRLWNRGLTGFIGLIMVIFLTEGCTVTVIEANQAHKKAEKKLSPDQVWGKKGTKSFEKQEYSTAIECFQKAIKLNPKEISWPLKLSEIYYTIEKFPEALHLLEEAVGIFPGDENLKKIHLARADVHYSWGENLEKKYDYLNAIKHYEEAYNIDKDLRPKDAAMDLNNIGFIYDFHGEKEKALDYYEKSLPLSRALGDRTNEARTLNNIGFVYSSLGEKEKALGYFEKALPINRAVGDRAGEAITLNNIGGVYNTLGEKDKALGYYEKSLLLSRAVGGVYDALGEKEKALGYFEQALPISRIVGDRTQKAITLNNIGGVYDALGEKEKALGYFEQALPLSRAVGDRAGEANTFGNMMFFWESVNNKQMAIFYGKQSVNAFQQLRENIVTLDKEIKHSYLKTKKDAYRYLINLLIGQHRLDEALLVLDMLKAEEYYQFLQKDSPSPLPDRQYQPLDFTPFEQQWLQKFNNITANITDVSSQYQELLMAKPKNETERNRLIELETQLKDANKTYDQFLIQLKDAFEEYDQKVNKGEYERLNLAEKPDSIQSILRDLDKTEGGKNVTLHYLVFDNKIQIILTTPSSQTVQSSAIDEEKLDTLIGKYQAAINYSRSRGVAPISQPPTETALLTSTELYDLIFKPIEKDLKDYGATNLMVYLDGVLRYIPLPVLFDGQNYLVQRFRISVLTTSSLLNIKDEPVQKLKILGMAAGKGGSDISALPNARAEIRNIVRDTGSGCSGFIDGKALVDENFTKTNMFQQLKTFSFPLVHIASHFNFSSENETQNYLMLGDSSKLTLKDIRLEGNLFHNVEMLVLAACQTAMGSSTGVEIDSFGELAQKSGAKSVVASLWIVNDKSSKDLMVSFYRDIKDHRFSSKIEAMRQAQLKLAGLDDLMQTNKQPKREKTPYASPYYWGPYIMMGNWR